MLAIIYLNYIFCYDCTDLTSSTAEHFDSNKQAAMLRSGNFEKFADWIGSYLMLAPKCSVPWLSISMKFLSTILSLKLH